MILSHFGWSYNYLLWGISWANVQRMLIDAPFYESEDSETTNKTNVKAIDLTAQNEEELIKFFENE